MSGPRPFVMRDRGGLPPVIRKPPTCDSCRGERTAHVAGTLWKCLDCGHQQTGREYLRGDPQWWEIVEQRREPQEVRVPSGVYPRTTQKPKPAECGESPKCSAADTAWAIEPVAAIPPVHGACRAKYPELLRALKDIRPDAGIVRLTPPGSPDRKQIGNYATAARKYIEALGRERWTVTARGLLGAIYIDTRPVTEKAA